MASSTNQGIAIFAFITAVNICPHLKKIKLLTQMFKLKTAYFEVQEEKEENGSFSIPLVCYSIHYNTFNLDAYEKQVRKKR